MSRVAQFYRTHGLRHAWWYAGGVAALLVTNGFTVHIPVELAGGIDALRDGDSAGARSAAVTIAAMGLAVIVARTLSRVLFFTPGRRVEADIKLELFEKLLRHQPAFHQKHPPGDLVSRASSDVGFLRMLAGFGAFGLANTVIALVFAVGQMVRLSPTLAFGVLVPIGVALLASRGFIRRIFVLIQRMQQALADLSDHVLSSYQGVATVKGFVAEDAFVARFDVHNRAYFDTARARADVRAILGPLLGFGATTSVFVLLYFGGPMAIRGDLTVGELVAFTSLAAFLAVPLRGASFLLSIVKQADAALVRLGDVLDPEPERPDRGVARPVPSTPPRITLRDLTFAYPDAPDSPALRDVTLDVPPGSTLGLFGATGAGKSTLVRALTRVHNPPPGTIFVDGTDVRDLDLDAWRRAVSVVPQRAFLFSESVAENILLGAPDDGRLARVIAATALDVDLAALPSGVDTVVGEAGVMLSGGQRQRVALARGLARPHQLLVLDDVLSAVDHRTEGQLVASLRSAASRPTTILIANRLSALRHADHVVVLDGGRVVDQGTFDALIARPGPFRDTWLRQSDPGDEAAT